MSLLDRDIIVRFGEEQISLRDVVARAAQQDGMTHVVFEPSEAPRKPTAKVVDQKGYEAVLNRYFGCHDYRTAIVIETGTEISVFDEIKRRRGATAKLEA